MLSENRPSIEGKAASWACVLSGPQKSLHWGDQTNFIFLKKQDGNPRVKMGDPSEPQENDRFHYQALYTVPSKASLQQLLCPWNYLLLPFILLSVSMWLSNIRTQRLEIFCPGCTCACLYTITVTSMLFCSHLEGESASDSPTNKLGRQVLYINLIHYIGLLEKAYIFSSFMYTLFPQKFL